MYRNRILDILLLPKGLYRKVNNKVTALFFGVILIGFIDIGFELMFIYIGSFHTQDRSVLLYKYVLAAALIIITGLIDVLFFSLPVYDIFKFLKKRLDKTIDNTALIKTMKIYMLAHIWVFPITILYYIVFYGYTDMASLSIVQIVLVLFSIFVVPVWFSATITRGIKVILHLGFKYTGLVFITVFTWNTLLNTAFGFLTGKLLPVLFK